MYFRFLCAHIIYHIWAYKNLKKVKKLKKVKTKQLAEKLDEYLKITVNFTNWIKEKMKNSKDDVSAACNDYLKVLGLIALAYSWL